MPVLEDAQTAIDDSHLIRDRSTKISPNDPGAILQGIAQFQNSNSSKTNGVDLETMSKGASAPSGN